MLRTFQYRLSLTARQARALNQVLSLLAELYNAALQERMDAWKRQRKSITYYNQTHELTELRAEFPHYREFAVEILREPLQRVNRAFQAFFRRIKAGEKPGHPRYRSHDRYNSFATSRFRVEGDTLFLPKLGGFKMRLHRTLKGVPQRACVLRSGKRWRCSITCETGAPPEKQAVSSLVGIDVGLTTFATLSDGTAIENPRWLKQAEEEIARAQRNLATKKRRSQNRRRAREAVRRAHERVANRRQNFCHHVSKWLVGRYDFIAFEKLSIRAMVEGRLAKPIMDAAWGILLHQVSYKAADAGRYAVAVNPQGTSQICSGCGAVVRKPLSQRTHACPNCGLTIGRDHNSSLNILALGRSAVVKSPPKVLSR